MNNHAIVETSAVDKRLDRETIEKSALQVTIEEIDHRENAATYVACCAFFFNR